MRLRFLSFLCLSGVAFAAEPVTFPMELGTLKTIGAGNRTFDGVKVIGKDAVGIKITHEGGTSRIAYDKLPHELAARFSVDREAAKAQLQKEAQEGAAHERAMMEVERQIRKELEAAEAEENDDDAFIAELLAGEKPDPGGKTKMQRIAALRNYILELEKNFKAAKASYERRAARIGRTQKFYHSGPYRPTQKATQNRLDAISRTIGRHKEKLDQAGEDLRMAKEELSDLERDN